MPQAAPIISAVAAVGGLGYSVYAGERGAANARKAKREQKAASDNAANAARREQQRGADEVRRAKDSGKDVLALLSAGGGPGNPATVLTSPLGLTGGNLPLCL